MRFISSFAWNGSGNKSNWQYGWETSSPSICHEEWRDFESTYRGGFCGLCQMEVIDFTSWSEERLKAYFKNRPSDVCGRFYEHQLWSYTCEGKSFSVKHWLLAIIGGLIVLASREGSAQAQRTKVKIEQRSDFKSAKTPPDSIKAILKAFTSMDTTVVKYDFQAVSRVDLGEGTKNDEYLINGTIGGVVYHRPWYSPRRWWNGMLGWLEN